MEGVIVRALANVELPGAGQNQTVPLFNDADNLYHWKRTMARGELIKVDYIRI